MTAVLGIDAAWTATEPSGVALIRKYADDAPWECVAVAPSYAAFMAIADGRPVQWNQRPAPGIAHTSNLLTAAEQLLGGERVSVISVDMPMSKVKITGRRKADNDISRAYGSRGCGTHTPDANRPGAISTTMLSGLVNSGYKLAVSDSAISGDSVVEVYPHTALLTLLNRDYRVPYKVSRSLRYWPDTTVQERADLLTGEFVNIYYGLAGVINDIPDFLPKPPYAGSALAYLKRYEDVLDALVCAWVGACYIEGNATAYGDNNAVIWVPT